MEGTSFINPMNMWGSLEGIGKTLGTAGTVEELSESSGISSFTDIFKNAIDQVKETELDVERKKYLLSTGQLDDAHTLPIAEAKAALSLDVLISLRNKAVETYNELMKISL